MHECSQGKHIPSVLPMLRMLAMQVELLKILARVRGLGIRFILELVYVILYSITPTLQTHNILFTPSLHNHQPFKPLENTITNHVWHHEWYHVWS